MKLSASKLRQDIYRILDEVAETGIPVEIERRGKTLKIIVEKPPSKLDRLIRRDHIVGDPEDIVHMDWSHEWKPYL